MASPQRTQVIVVDLIRRIASGELKEGDTLPTEPILSHLYGVGRSTVREAVKTLSAKGFVTVRHGTGTSVAPRAGRNELDPEVLRVMGYEGAELFGYLMEAREAIEPAIASLAAERATAEQIETMRTLVVRLADVGESHPDVHAEVDIAFHETLAVASCNPVLRSLHASIVQLGLASRRRTVRVQGAVDRAIFWHRHILEAVEAHDSVAVQDAMRMHLRQVRSELERVPENGHAVVGAEG